MLLESCDLLCTCLDMSLYCLACASYDTELQESLSNVEGVTKHKAKEEKEDEEAALASTESAAQALEVTPSLSLSSRTRTHTHTHTYIIHSLNHTHTFIHLIQLLHLSQLMGWVIAASLTGSSGEVQSEIRSDAHTLGTDWARLLEDGSCEDRYCAVSLQRLSVLHLKLQIVQSVTFSHI
jgi:hypothetical protein